MTGKWKKIRSIFAIALSTAIVFTAVPGGSFVSNAAQVYEITAGDEDPVVEAPVTEDPADPEELNMEVPVVSGGDVAEPTISDGDAPIVEEPTVSDGDASVTDEPTVSDGDSTLDPELYQSKKLKIKSLQNTIYTGQKNIKAAVIGYESTTSDDGLGYQVSSITYSGASCLKHITVDTDDPNALYISADDDVYVGKYEITLLPKVPKGIHAEPVKFVVNVVPSIYNISLTGPLVAYKQKGKALSIPLQVTTGSYYKKKPHKPTALEWTISIFDIEANDFVPYTGKDISVKGGKVNIARSFEIEEDIKIKITSTAKDYEGNEKTSASWVVKVVSQNINSGKAILVKEGHYQYKDNDIVTYQDLTGASLQVLTAESDRQVGDAVNYMDVYDANYFTYKSSSKDVLVASDGTITILKVPNKKVTLTATSLDGKYKTSITITLKKRPLDLEHTIILYGDVMYGYSSLSGNVTFYTPDYTSRYEGKQNKILLLRIFDLTGGGEEVYDFSYSIKGAKNVTSSYLKFDKEYQKKYGSWKPCYDSYIALIPTQQTVELTLKSGKNEQKFILINTEFQAEKCVSIKGEPKITTSFSLYNLENTQTIKLYVGKQNAEGTVNIYPDDAWQYSSLGNYKSYYYMTGLPSGDYNVDENGYVTLYFGNVKGQIANMKGRVSSEGYKDLQDFKFQVRITDKEGKSYAPYLLTIKYTGNLPKTDYKLKTSYKINKRQKQLRLSGMVWNDRLEENKAYVNYGERNYTYYQPITYIGTREPKDTITYLDFKVDLGTDLLNGSDLAQCLNICWSDSNHYYLAISDYKAYLLLKEANAKIIAEGKDVAKYGRDAKLDGYIYIDYYITTQDEKRIIKNDKVKVSIVIPKSDYNDLIPTK